MSGIYASKSNQVSWGSLTSIPTSLAYLSQVEINFGSIPVMEMKFNIVNSLITTSSVIIAQVSGVTPTGKDFDEIECDSFEIRCTPYRGGFVLYIRSLEGLVADRFKINYSFST
jgi:hypothetical protein